MLVFGLWLALCDAPQIGSKLLRKYGIPLLFATVEEIWTDVFERLLTSVRDTSKLLDETCFISQGSA